MLKHVFLVPDGMADEPLDELGGRTPLEAAVTPGMDALATTGTMGLVQTVPAGMAPGSDVANLAVLGYDPAAVYTGRAPLEAANIGVDLGSDDAAWRCNLVAIDDGVMRDFTAGHIAPDDARRVVARLQERLGSAELEFHAGVSYRNLMVWRGGGQAADEAACPPPHDILDRPVAEYLPQGAGGATLRRLMARAHDEIAGLSAATDIWLWGQGRAPRLPAFRDLRGVSGAVVGAVDLVKGIGRLAGMEVVDVPGATGDLDTDYGAKARAALDCLGRHDVVFVHVEAPDEAGHMGDVGKKVRAIERVDAEVLGPLLDDRRRPAVLVLPDHPTPIRLRTHVGWPVPFVYRGGGAGAAGAGPAAAFSERAAAATGLIVPDGPALVARFLEADG
jgi:2,3-bisphosphoglycerate-independent phosphoglycerate mutase